VDEFARYERQIIIPELGVEGQRRLAGSRALVVGCGGLGSAISFYLAAVGVGKLGLVDGERVEENNLQRQILYTEGDIGKLKVEVAGKRLLALNGGICVEKYPFFINKDNAEEIIGQYDIVFDGTDNYASRMLINECCLRLDKPFVYGAVLGFEGQVMPVVPGEGPCLACLFGDVKAEDVPGTSEHGVLGAVPGVIGTLEVVEGIKILAGVGKVALGRLIVYDGLEGRFEEYPVVKRGDCPVCGG